MTRRKDLSLMPGSYAQILISHEKGREYCLVNCYKYNASPTPRA